MNQQLQDALQVPLSDLNSVSFDNYHTMLAFIKHHALPDFICISDDISPLDYLTNRYMELVLTTQKANPSAEIKWDFRLISQYYSKGDKRIMLLTSDCTVNGTSTHTSTHILSLNDTFKFNMLMIPFFNSGFAEHYVKDLTAEAVANTH